MRRRQVRDRLRGAALPESSDPDLLVEAVAAHLGRAITLGADPRLRSADQVNVDDLQDDAGIVLRIPADGDRLLPICRALGMVLYPNDQASARCAAQLLEQHLFAHREFERQIDLHPVEAFQEKAAGLQPLLLRPALAPRRRR